MNIKNFLFSGFRFSKDEYELQLQFFLLNSILSLIFLTLMIMSAVRYVQGDFTQSIVDFLAAFASSLAILYARKTKQAMQHVVPTLLLLFYILVSVTFLNIGILGANWYTVLLISVFFLRGKSYGVLFSIASVIAVITLGKVAQDQYTIYEYLYILVPIILSVIFLYLYERRNEIVKNLLEEQKNILQREVDKKTKELSKLLQKSEELASVMEQSIIEIYIIDFYTNEFLYVNEGAVRALGYTKDELLNMTIFDINKSLTVETVKRFKEHLKTNENAMNISQHTRKDTTTYGVQSFIHKIYYEGREACVIYDIKMSDGQKAQSEILRQKELLTHQAHYDLLTELPNRQLFYDRLSHAIARAKRSKSQFALLFIDLDSFKEINDTYGHEIGDAVLIEVAKRLQSSVRESDTVARLAGDEFLIILEEFNSRESLESIAKLLVKTLALTIDVKDLQLHITCSIGISIYPDDSNEGETLLKYADNAMYCAKNLGKNNYVFYKHQ